MNFILRLDEGFQPCPQKLLCQLLEKFGVPPKLVRLLKALHKDVLVKFAVEVFEHEVKFTM